MERVTVLQQRNEASPTPLAGAITYSINFLVFSLVIVMNEQPVRFLCVTVSGDGDTGSTEHASGDSSLPQGKLVRRRVAASQDGAYRTRGSCVTRRA